MSDVPTIICVVWKALALVYWAKMYKRESWDDVPPEAELVIWTFGASVMTDWGMTLFVMDLTYAVLAKVLNQCFLIGYLLVAHRVLEKQVSGQMTLRHRVCYALLVENCVAFNLTWNYVQTATLVSSLLARDFDIGPDAVVSVNLVLLAICVLVTVTVELVFRGKFRWTVASFPPLLIWAFNLRRVGDLDDTFPYALLVLAALLLVTKIAPVARPDFPQEGKQEHNVEDQMLEIYMT
ncbi:Hypp3762 [Branchiostoma lanceolatum]|uniref:Hypp3762 protein n=1 Tax=Branchiostoma lanceolatum TaxID=7740 RepID=A0A8K0EYS5_BRALA|nr:Hypp3762 [Branchiostoma lanceolatum]